LKQNLFKNRGDRKVGRGRGISRNIEEWIRGSRGRSTAVENEIDEIGWMGRSKKQNENVVKLRKVENGTGNVGRTRGIRMTELRNIEADRKSLRPVDVARGMSAEVTLRSRDLKCQQRQGQ
jgi:hypothetical protein